MRRGRYLSIALVALACCLAPAQTGATDRSVSAPAEEPEARVLTDGRLRAGHFETIRVKGFRIPGTFFDHRNKRTYFRNGERLELEVLWYGPERSFAVGSSYPDPVLVRTHGSRHG